jgi:hypothetical protein
MGNDDASRQELTFNLFTIYTYTWLSFNSVVLEVVTSVVPFCK